MNCYFFKVTFALFCFAFFAISGCISSAPSRFYLLQPTEMDKETRSEIKNAKVKNTPIALGIGPVEIPEYLCRPQIVTMLDDSVIQIAEFDRWAEPLKSNILRVITENLSHLLNTNQITTFPWKNSLPKEYQIEIKLLRFDGKLGNDLFLNTLWRIVDSKTTKSLVIERTEIREPTKLSDYKSFVNAQNRALATLCKEIAVALNTIIEKR